MIRPIILAVLSAFLMFCSFSPLRFWFLAWVSLIPLFFLLYRSPSYWVAFGRAYVTGFLYFLLVFQWIHYVSLTGLVLLSAYLAIYFGLFGVFYRWVARFKTRIQILLLPAAWVVLEFIRGTVFTGFNWGSLGHSQASFKDLVRIAALAGVPAVSFIVVAGNFFIKSIAVALVRGQKVKRNIIGGIIYCCCIWVSGVAAYSIPYKLPPKAVFMNVVLVQPNISLAQSADPLSRAVIVRKQIEMSRKALKKRPDLIIWPETSFPGFSWEQPELMNEVRAFAREKKVSLLIGAVTKEGDKHFNSALLIWPDGEIVKTYSKRHLVLFGEHIPFRDRLPFLARIAPIHDFSPGSDNTVFDLPNGVKFSVLLCFEDTIPGLAARYVRLGADFLVNMTNDAWFRDSGEQRMHLDNAIFRAIENRRPLIRVTNTGESCLVEKNGIAAPCVRDSSLKKVDIEGITVVRFPIVPQPTVYRKYGDFFVGLCFLGMLVVPLLLRFVPSKWWSTGFFRLSQDVWKTGK